MYLAEVQLYLVRAVLIFVSLSRRPLPTSVYSATVRWFNKYPPPPPILCCLKRLHLVCFHAAQTRPHRVHCHTAGACRVFWVWPKIASYHHHHHHHHRRHRRNRSRDTLNAGSVVCGVYEIGVRGLNHAWGSWHMPALFCSVLSFGSIGDRPGYRTWILTHFVGQL